MNPMFGTYLDHQGLIEYLYTIHGIRVCTQTIYNWCSLEKIPYERFSGRQRFHRETIDRWIENQVQKFHRYRSPIHRVA
ncbi:MAG TPA: helix-turn-helix domain-containing protein [Kiritimatiellia bacterium]|jgi:hypothetical protein|nr:MAG: Helix-turn-helix domain protein [Candidatus Hydrogenedentes bacterium ADurb.Bin179]HQM23846.1 helix-turn-helix domain-containing protein [Kiritimatiellia bacterium]